MAGNDTFVEILEGEVFKHYYDGEWRASTSRKSVDIINPMTKKTQHSIQGSSFHIFVALSFDLGLGQEVVKEVVKQSTNTKAFTCHVF